MGQLNQAQCAPARPPSRPPMIDVIESLEKELCALEDLIQNLGARLEPISSITPTSAVAEVDQRGTGGSIVHALWSQVARAEKIRRDVRFMLDTLDV